MAWKLLLQASQLKFTFTLMAFFVFFFSKPYKDNVIYTDTANSKQDLLEYCRVETCQITLILVIFLTEILHMNKDYFFKWRLDINSGSIPRGKHNKTKTNRKKSRNKLLHFFHERNHFVNILICTLCLSWKMIRNPKKCSRCWPLIAIKVGQNVRGPKQGGRGQRGNTAQRSHWPPYMPFRRTEAKTTKRLKIKQQV